MNASEFRRKTLYTCLSSIICLCTLFIVSTFNQPAFAQATIQSGSIQGTVSDPSGAVVSGAKVTITNKATAQKIALTTNASGAYNSGPLAPGDYPVRLEAGGFATAELASTVTVGNITPGNIKLAVGSASQVVEVAAAGATVNTEQPTVQGVITSTQLENLPMNGR